MSVNLFCVQSRGWAGHRSEVRLSVVRLGGTSQVTGDQQSQHNKCSPAPSSTSGHKHPAAPTLLTTSSAVLGGPILYLVTVRAHTPHPQDVVVTVAI